MRITLPLLAALLGVAACHAGVAPAAGGAVSEPACRAFWVELSLPELASVPVAERDEARRRIMAQQDEVMARLRELGALESARVQIVRNAIAVCLSPDKLAQARAIAGVTGVTPARDREFQRHP